jgi:hypothetical protein
VERDDIGLPRRASCEQANDWDEGCAFYFRRRIDVGDRTSSITGNSGRLRFPQCRFDIGFARNSFLELGQRRLVDLGSARGASGAALGQIRAQPRDLCLDRIDALPRLSVLRVARELSQKIRKSGPQRS